MRAKQPAAGSAEGQDGDRDVPVFRDVPALGAADHPDVAVNLGELLRPRVAVEPVHILSDQPELLETAAPSRRLLRAGFGRLVAMSSPPPVVPFPDKTRVTREGFRRGEILCAVVPPEAVGAAKGRHPLSAEIPAPVSTVTDRAVESF